MLEGKKSTHCIFLCLKTILSIQSMTKPVSIKLLRQAWNSFARLLDIDWAEAFMYPICGPSPDTIICDGTLLGFQKDLLVHTPSATPQEVPSSSGGSRHSVQVLLKSRKSRELLLTYSGYTKDRKGQQSPTELTATEFRQLKKLLQDEGPKPLAELISRLSSESGCRSSPQPFREFLSELSHNSPVCGLLQVAGNQEVLTIMEAIASGVDVTQSPRREQLKLLQQKAPVLRSFILKCYRGHNLPYDVRCLILRLRDLIVAPFICCEPAFPPPSQPNPLSFFPNLPQVQEKGIYEADHHKISSDDQDACRKYSSNHTTLTPGIFTLFCRHGICYGFQVMESHESPRHPFEIFLCRFPMPPQMIIYNNGCKLHQYVLNREPVHFKNTIFLVDRFHWQGHVGCSSGYSLDSYSSLDVASINSQVNEQANARLQRIKGHIAYMKPDNFMFHVKLFFALQNKAS